MYIVYIKDSAFVVLHNRTTNIYLTFTKMYWTYMYMYILRI